MFWGAKLLLFEKKSETLREKFQKMLKFAPE